MRKQNYDGSSVILGLLIKCDDKEVLITGNRPVTLLMAASGYSSWSVEVQLEKVQLEKV